MKKSIILLGLLFLIAGIAKAQFLNQPQAIDVNSAIVTTVTITPTGGTTIFDMQSFGSPQHIYQSGSGNLHDVYMSSPLNDTNGFNARTVKYYASTNKGTSWSFIINAGGMRSGFPAITCVNDGRALIALQSILNPPQHIMFLIDAFEGLGSFTTLEAPFFVTPILYPKVVTTNSVALPRKFVFTGTNGDSCFINSGLSLTAPGLFSGYQSLFANQYEGYGIARGTDGRIGVTYIASHSVISQELGCVYFIESTDNGASFSSPLKIFQATPLSGDTVVGAFKGISIVYQGNSPKVVFEVAKVTGNGQFFSTFQSAIRFWSPVLPGFNPNKSVIIADYTNIPYVQNSPGNDALTPYCRPVIGSATDNALIYVAFMVASQYTGGAAITCSYNNIYFTYSANSFQWAVPVKINNDTIPRRDWTYPSICPVNDKTVDYFANIVATSDSIPGSYVNNPSNGASLAKQMFLRVKIVNDIPPSIPVAPVLQSPADGSQIQPRNPNMKWFTVNNANTYRLQFALNSLFTAPIFDSANIIQTNLQLPQNFLSSGTKIYWRVNATNSYGTGPWSNIWSFTTDTVPFYSVSGIIRYKDNNQLVSGGYVKAMKIKFPGLDIITLDSALINSDGTYILGSVRSDNMVYISPYPNSTPPNDNFVPTYYPSEILWENATPLNVNANLTNINVYVYRTINTIGYNSIEGKLFKNVKSTVPLSDAVVYAQSSGYFYRFSVTDVYGRYFLNYLNPASYKLYASRLGYKSDSLNVVLNTGQNLNPVNFTLLPFYSGIGKLEDEIPSSFNLYQNYPNPFNPVTKIKLDVPKTSSVVLKIFDITGRLITNLVNTKLQTGVYNVSWDASAFASGVYFLRMETESYTKSQKMLLIK
jgi:hypothetical protein